MGMLGMGGAAGGTQTGAAAGGAVKGAIGGDKGAASPATVAAPVSGAQLPSNVQMQMPTSNVIGSGNPDGPIGTNLAPTSATGAPLSQPAQQPNTMQAINNYINSPQHQAMMAQNQRQMQQRNAAMGINAGS